MTPQDIVNEQAKRHAARVEKVAALIYEYAAVNYVPGSPMHPGNCPTIRQAVNDLGDAGQRDLIRVIKQSGWLIAFGREDREIAMGDKDTKIAA